MKSVSTIILLVLAFAFALPHIAHGGIGAFAGDCDDNPGGAMNVERDLYALHPGDINQFGQDEAYNSITGGENGIRYPFHRER